MNHSVSRIESVNISSLTYGRVFALFINAILMVDMVRMVSNNNVSFVTLVQYTIYIGVALYVYWKIVFENGFKIDKSYFIWLILILIIPLVSYFVCSEICRFYSYFIMFIILRILPGIYLGSRADKYGVDITINSLIKYRFIWLAYAVVGCIWIPAHTSTWNQYSMTYGYNLVIPACLVFFYFIRTLDVKYLIYTGIFCIFILLRGSRGALLCFLVFALLAYIMVKRERKDNGKIAKILFVSIIGIVVLLFFDVIMLALYKVFPSSRTLYFLSGIFTNGTVSFDTGRFDIQALYWEAIQSNPLKINGIFSDRIYYSSVRGAALDITNHPHNLIIEILYQFGVPLGTLVLIYLFFISAKSIAIASKSDDPEMTGFLLMLSAIGIFKLFLSASYLLSVEFFIYMGYARAVIKTAGNTGG